ncbi:putative flavin-containing polyamine oxidase [Aspergillus taichungensis]|uniref:Amine oxidase n=1 Tax=Aspergillus taichungensis TaxID=482145 RepID=A0A2J5HF66_9EURO|nr:putative flavin-containing polyamine oxidase [Aspergillus taichungensis]
MMFPTITKICALLGAGTLPMCAGYVAQPRSNQKSDDLCTETTIAILGGGMAGVSAAQALKNASITDFFLLESRDTLGGRVWHTDFGQNRLGNPYTIELGANWVEKYNLSNTHTTYRSIGTYNETGYTDYRHLLDAYSSAYVTAAQAAGQILTSNLQDQTARTGLALAGWQPQKHDMAAQAVEWWNWDFEDASTPETSSFAFGIAGENLTFHQFGPRNHMVTDPRGYRTIIEREASRLFPSGLQDHRIWLDSHVTDIEYSPKKVTVRTKDGSCVRADYAICTFSLGVLQDNDAVRFHPPLPEWKQTAIHKFTMGTYTKIFMQFEEAFWPTDTLFFLYASPTTRGYYPIFQSLTGDGLLPDSNILFVTVVGEEAYRVERQTDNETKDEILAVLREMFPDREIPEPTAFTYPRWSREPWTYGSYSNWPAGTTLEMHQNLRANVDRLWFAGEATSAPYFGFLHGALYEGREAGEHVAALVQKRCMMLDGLKFCDDRKHYERLHGTTPSDSFSAENGWPVSSMEL